MERQRKELSLADVAGLGSALVTFGLVQGALYLQGYWGKFGLDPFQFVAVGELALAGLAGIGVVLGMLLFAALLGSWLKGKFSGVRPKNRLLGVLSPVALLLGLGAMIWWTSAWGVLVAALASVICLVVLKLSPVVPSAIKESPWLIYVVLMLVYVSFASSWLGTERAQKILDGNATSLSAVSTDKEVLSGLNLIGRLGDTYAFWDPVRRTAMLLPAADVRRVEIARKAAVTAPPAPSPAPSNPPARGASGRTAP